MQEEITVTPSDVGKAFDPFKNWGSPGRDQIQAIWWKTFTPLHGKLAAFYENMTQNSEDVPPWLVFGRTLLLPKLTTLKMLANFALLHVCQ